MRFQKLTGTIVALVTILFVVQNASADWFGKKTIKGSGDRTTESRDLESFDRIETNGSLDIHVIVGQEQTVKVTIDDNIIEYIKTEVDDGTLEVFCRKSYSTRRGGLVEITVPSLIEVASSGSGDIRVERLEGERFEFNLAGSGDFLIDGATKEMDIRLAGSGDGTLAGKAEVLDIRVSGSGDINGRELESKEAYVKISGSGDVRVFAKESFEGRVSGSGDITYWGKPEQVKTKVSGSGDIRRR